MEFVQYHPTGLPGSGILITEGCRGEGGIMVNKDGYRYLQDYGMGPETPLGEPKNKYMELGPRDKLSQAFWHEWRAGRTIATSRGDVVHLDLRHLGAKKLQERLPFICELTKAYVGFYPVNEPIPGAGTVRGRGMVGLDGANRLGSNSLAMQKTIDKLAELKDRFKRVRIQDTSSVFKPISCMHWSCNTAWMWRNAWRIRPFTAGNHEARINVSTKAALPATMSIS